MERKSRNHGNLLSVGGQILALATILAVVGAAVMFVWRIGAQTISEDVGVQVDSYDRVEADSTSDNLRLCLLTVSSASVQPGLTSARSRFVGQHLPPTRRNSPRQASLAA